MPNNTNKKYDVLILGGGPAGLTAAIYTSRAQLKTLIIEGVPSGGQLMLTSEVENFPGFPNSILGPDLIQNFRDQAEKFGAEFVTDNVVSLEGSEQIGFKVTASSGVVYEGKTVILATGASAKWLGLDSEKKFVGRGVSACATCDGFFFRNKVVAVVGGGDAAMEEAIFLTNFASKVYVLVRGTKEDMKASKIMQERALNNQKIEFKFNSEVVEVLGEDKVSGLKVKNNLTGEESVLSDVEGLFVAIGHKPNTEFLKDLLDMEKFGYIKVFDNTKTSVPGVFVAGDVADHRYRQAITASGMGCMAAIDTIKFLSEKK